VGTAALNVAFAIGIIALFKRDWRAKLRTFFANYGRLILFVLSLAAMLATLWMQYYGNLSPCLMCWWQRICMYPLVLISGIAILKNTALNEVADYILGLSIIGAGIALYQHLLQMLPQGALIPCDAANECGVRSVFEFGYITIPWMALSMFVVFILIAWLGRRRVL